MLSPIYLRVFSVKQLTSHICSATKSKAPSNGRSCFRAKFSPHFWSPLRRASRRCSLRLAPTGFWVRPQPMR